MEIGKKHGLTQDVMSDLYASFIQSELSAIPDREAMLAEFEADPTKRANRIATITDYLKANLGEPEFKEFAETALTTNPSPAAVLKMMTKIPTKTPKTIFVPGPVPIISTITG